MFCAVKATDAEPLLYALDVPTFVAVGVFGACGTVDAVIEFDADAVASESPLELTAFNLNV